MKAKWMLAAVASFSAAAGPHVANAADAFATTNVNMRAGPSTRFPAVTTLPAGAAVEIFGCTESWGWCDTSWQWLRGWVSARYLQSLYEGRRVMVPEYGEPIGLPIITFQFGTYWARWYSDRPWYRDRDRWERGWRSDWVDYDYRPSYDADRVIRVVPDGYRGGTPLGIRKKGPGFCPPGQAKKGRC